MNHNITQARLRELLDYDPETGVFLRKVSRFQSLIGAVAGGDDGRGYIRISVDGIPRHRAHRLAWLYVYGEWPDHLDHIDGNRSNNAIANLRECTTAQNQANQKRRVDNTSGHKGVTFHRATGRWLAQIRNGKGSIYLGLHHTPEAAAAAYAAAARLKYGEFARTDDPA